MKFLAKYDLPILVPYLLTELESRSEQAPRLIKKGNLYFSISTEDWVFKDALLFTSPCKLSDYLQQNGVVECKSIFPYSLFNSVEQIRAQTIFPSHAQFYSELKEENVSEEDYQKAKAEYDRRLVNLFPNLLNIFFHNIFKLRFADRPSGENV